MYKTPNDKLPEEIVKQINSEAKKAATVIGWGEYDAGPASSARMTQVSRIDPIQKEFYIKGATEWAPWKVKHDELKERCDKMEAEHADLNLALAAMLNGYQNLSQYQKDWFTVPKDLINYYTRMVLEYDTQGKEGEKEPTDPCPHCGKELSRDRNLCCRECGKEVVRPEHNVSIGGHITYCRDCGFPVDECNCITK